VRPGIDPNQSSKRFEAISDSEAPGIDQQEWMSAVLEVRPLNIVGYHGLTRQRAQAQRGSGRPRLEPDRALATRARARLAVVDQSSYITFGRLQCFGYFRKLKRGFAPCRLAASRGMLFMLR